MNDPMEQFGGDVHHSEGALRERAEARTRLGQSIVDTLTRERDEARAAHRETTGTLAATCIQRDEARAVAERAQAFCRAYEAELAEARQHVVAYQVNGEVVTRERDELLAQLAAERQKRCGTCRWWEKSLNPPNYTNKDSGLCRNESSECHSVLAWWSPDHGCPKWEASR